MKFIEQIRAARAVLQLTQADVAEMTGLSKQAILKVENGESSPNSTTQNKLLRVYEEKGIIFTNSGIEKNDSPITIISADTPEDCYLKILNDVYETCSNTSKSELLISNADDRVSPDSVNQMYRKIRKSGIAMRQLVEEGNTYLMGDISEYRYIPKEYFINLVTLVYAGKVAILTSNENTATIINDDINAKTRRNQFNLIWETLEQPEVSNADEKF